MAVAARVAALAVLWQPPIWVHNLRPQEVPSFSAAKLTVHRGNPCLRRGHLLPRLSHGHIENNTIIQLLSTGLGSRYVPFLHSFQSSA
jgi:hypothetical protein